MPDHYSAPAAMIGLSDERLGDALGQMFADAQALINEGRVDLVVLTARRLACVYEMLVREGMKPLKGCRVVSDRYLELHDERNWSGARFLVLDDTVILGTTLYQLCQRLQESNAAEVLFRSVVLDTEQYAPYLTEAIGLETISRRGRAQVEQFSYELVRGLFVRGIPYFSDFVTTGPTQMTTQQWESVVASPDWLVADVTAPLLDDPESGHRHTAYSHLPHHRTLNGYFSRLPGGLDHLVDSFKIRSYVKADGGSVEVVFVPLGLVRPVHRDHLDEVLDVLAAYLDDGEVLLSTLGCRRWAPEAKHRLVQFLVSVCGLSFFWETLSDRAGVPPLSTGSFARLPLELHFGEHLEAALEAMSAAVSLVRKPVHNGPVLQPRNDEPSPSQLAAQTELGELLWRTREFLGQLTPPGKPAPGEITKIGIELTQPIVSVFGWIHANIEMQQRKEIRALGSVEAYSVFSDEPARALNQGLTGRELARALMPESLGADAWTRSLVMLGIDAGNDLGVVVPLTKVDKARDVVYRCYRLGETAHLVDKPLAQSNSADFDLMTRTVQDGFPLTHATIPVRAMFTRWATGEDSGASGGLKALLGLKEKVVLGRPIQRFDGEVVGVDEERRLIAHLTDAEDGEVEVRTVDPELFDPQVREGLGVGSTFSWTLYEHSGDGAKTRTSTVRLHRPTTIDSAAMLARVRRAASSHTEA